MEQAVSIAISVIVCTCNRSDSLRRCVRALSAINTDFKWELVVVNNSSDDDTSEFLASLPPLAGNAQIVTAFEAKRGLAAARNRGLNHARGPIVAFTDDDCYVSEDYVDAMIDAFAAGDQIGFVGGRVLLYDQSDLKITVQEREDYLVFRPRTFIAAGTIHGANMAFRKTVLDHIGGFDETLGAGTNFACGEDIDALARALWAGFSGSYDPRPTVYHHHGRKTKRDQNDLQKGYDRGRGAYYAKYILRSDSRSEYLKQWIEDLKNGPISGRGRERFSAVGKSLRELSGAYRYVAARAYRRLCSDRPRST